MSEVADRLKQALDFVGLKNPAIEKHTGVKANDWANVRKGNCRVNETHLTGLKIIAPEFVYWVMTGEELPEAGQISPETEESRRNLRKA